MSNPFAAATKKKSFLRMTLFGPSGSGKTYSALKIASALSPDGKIAVIDTERGSASKYADLFKFDVVELASFSPRDYISMINAAAANGYSVLIIDSLSHAWSGPGGVLEIVDNEAARSKSNNSYVAWRKGTPEHNALIDAMLNAQVHVIATMRSKTEYVLEQDQKTGRSTPRKVGLAPIQRDGMEYEFDVVGEMDMGNTLLVSKSRCPALTNAVISKPGQEIADKLRAWLSDGVTPEPAPAPQPAPEVKPAATEIGHEPDSTPPADPADDIDAALGRTVPEDAPDAARETSPAAGGDELSTLQKGTAIDLIALRAKVWPSWSGQTSFYAMTIQDMENKKIKWTGPFWLGMKKHAPDWKEEDVHTLLGCAMHDFKGAFGDLLLKIVAALPEAQVPA